MLPSRRPALDDCRGALGAGPVLLTGEAGVGKTWLWRRLEAEAPPSRRWACVDLTPSNGPAEFYRLIGREIGLTEPGGAGPSRVEVADHLAERHADGERMALVIDEAHNLAPEVWEEVRVLANRLDRPDGFAALLLVGQTALARRFSAHPLASIEARLAARVHLGPIDVDEAAELLARLRPGRDWPRGEVEALHRDAAGNPRRMLRRVRVAPIPRLAEARPGPIPIASAPADARPPVPGPLAGPSRPPLRVEDNLIEVGWSPEDPDHPPSGSGRLAPAATRGQAEAGEESVNDHYAALQAWREWADNQGRLGTGADPDRAQADAIDDRAGAEADDPAEDAAPVADRPTVWADGQQSFAPFSQLFSRLAAQAQARATE